MEPGFYHLNLHNISRGNGRNVHAAWAYNHARRVTAPAVTAEAAAAYRHAWTSGNGDQVFDYRRKIGVTWSGVIAPDDAPEWMRDPRRLWLAVDAWETRSNARLARELVIGLPHQVGLDDHIAMLTAFLRSTCVDPHRLVADIAIHAPPVHAGGDSRNWHAHVLLTDRSVDSGGFMATKDRRTQAKEFLLGLRVAWTLVHNAHMEKLGLPYRIDHRALLKQRDRAILRQDFEAATDLDREPQRYLGRAAHAKTHPRYRVFQDRLAENAGRLQRNIDRAEAADGRLQRRLYDAIAARQRSYQQNVALWHQFHGQPLSESELRQRYGRPATRWHRLAHMDRVREAARIASRQGWVPRDSDTNAPAIFNFLKEEVPTRGPGQPIFRVTSRDLAFIFYSMGLIRLKDLRNTLEGIWQFEIDLFPKKTKMPDWLHAHAPVPPPPPGHSQREIDLQTQIAWTGAIRARRTEVQAAFEARYVNRNHHRARRHEQGIARAEVPHHAQRMGLFLKGSNSAQGSGLPEEFE